MVKRTSILIVVSVALISGCASTGNTDDELARFLGKSVKDVTAEIGRPDSVFNMQDGTWHYIWTETSGYSGTGASVAGTSIFQGSPKECRRVLVVNKEKIVVNYNVEGRC